MADFKDFKDLQQQVAAAAAGSTAAKGEPLTGKLRDLASSLPNITVGGVTLTPDTENNFYSGHERNPTSVDEVNGAGYISVIYQNPAGGDVRIEVHDDNHTAYISGYLGGRGVEGPHVAINGTGVVDTLRQGIEGNSGLLKAIQDASNAPQRHLASLTNGVQLANVQLTSNEAAQHAVANPGGKRQVTT